MSSPQMTTMLGLLPCAAAPETASATVATTSTIAPSCRIDGQRDLAPVVIHTGGAHRPCSSPRSALNDPRFIVPSMGPRGPDPGAEPSEMAKQRCFACSFSPARCRGASMPQHGLGSCDELAFHGPMF